MVQRELTGQGVYLGRQGDDANIQVYVDLTDWLEEYGAGSGVMLFTSPDGKVWPLYTEVDAEAKKMTGEITQAETAQYGNGVIEARWLVGGNVMASEKYNAYILPQAFSGEVPRHITPSWVQYLILGFETSRGLINEARDFAREAAEIKEDVTEEMAAVQEAAESAGNSAASAGLSAENAEAWANGTRSGAEVPSTDDAYNKHAKYWADEAEGQAENAEAWANGTRGGADIPSGDEAYNKHAKYWANQAAAYASAAMQGTPEGYASIVSHIAGEFDPTAAYAAGAFVWNQAVLYRFTADHAAGAWTGEDAAEVKMSESMAEMMRSLLAGLSVSPVWESGTINTAGTLQASTTRIRTNSRVFTNSFTAVIPSGMQFSLREYDLSGVYKGYTGWMSGTARVQVNEAKRFRFVARYTDDAEIDASAGSGIVITEDKYTDSTLTLEGKAADAKTVGDALANASCGHGVISSGSFAISDFTENGWYLIYNTVELSDRPEQFASGGFLLRVSGAGNAIEQEIMPIDGGLYAYRIVGKAWTVINTAKPLAGKKIAIIGDSISDKANTTAATRYYDVVDAELGTVSTEYAMSGCGYKRKYNNGDTFYEQAAKIDTDTDLVLIFGSFNDHNVYDTDGLGEVTDQTTNTVLGCVYTTLQTIFTRAPNAAVGVILPTPWAQYPPYEKNTMQYAYINGIKEIAGMYGVPVLDLYTGSNMRPWEAAFRANYYTENGVQDSGTHPSSAGHKRFAPKVTAFVRSILG